MIQTSLWRSLLGKVTNLKVRLWPKRLFGQMVLMVLLALVLAQGLSLWILSNAHELALKNYGQRMVTRQVGSLILLMEQTPEKSQTKLIRALRRPGQHHVFYPQVDIDIARTAAERRIQRQLLTVLGGGYKGRIRLSLKEDDRDDEDDHGEGGGRHGWHEAQTERHRALGGSDGQIRTGRWGERGPLRGNKSPRFSIKRLVIAVQLNDGRWLVSRISTPELPPLAAKQTLITMLVSSVLVLFVIFWQLKRITRPLGQLALAANELGRGKSVTTLVEEGPQDIRDTVSAFNRMSERLERFVSDRTRMLAALSHDLRTPMTSMRLRLELMGASAEQARLLASLDEMQQMSEGALAFVRQSGDVEATQRVDLHALLDSQCEDLKDLGMAVEFTGQHSVVLESRPVSLKRALRNLIENAATYGTCAKVELLDFNDRVEVIIRDEGPGIAEHEQASVFEPFVRLESSRNRATGGVGLGLSIALQVIRSHGGDITLKNLDQGLEVRVTLPRC